MDEQTNLDRIGLDRVDPDRVETTTETADDTEGHSLGAAILVTQLYGQRPVERFPETARPKSADHRGFLSRLRGGKRG